MLASDFDLSVKRPSWDLFAYWYCWVIRRPPYFAECQEMFFEFSFWFTHGCLFRFRSDSVSLRCAREIHPRLTVMLQMNIACRVAYGNFLFVLWHCRLFRSCPRVIVKDPAFVGFFRLSAFVRSRERTSTSRSVHTQNVLDKFCPRYLDTLKHERENPQSWQVSNSRYV